MSRESCRSLRPWADWNLTVTHQAMPMCLVWRLLDEFRQCAEEKGCDDDPPRDGSWRVKTASRPGSVCPWQLPIYLKYFEHFWTEKMFKRQQKSEGELLGELKWSSYMQISGTSPPHSPRRCGKGVILSESVRLVFSGLGRSRCLNPQVMLSTQPPFFSSSDRSVFTIYDAAAYH